MRELREYAGDGGEVLGWGSGRLTKEGRWGRHSGAVRCTSHLERSQVHRHLAHGQRHNRSGCAEQDTFPDALLSLFCRAGVQTQSTAFWIMARALRDFVADPLQGNGLLPLLGSIPDMESDTDSYVQLQTMCDTFPWLHRSSCPGLR